MRSQAVDKWAKPRTAVRGAILLAGYLGGAVATHVRLCALPIGCLLYTLSDNPIWLIAVQILDGVGAGVFGIMQTLVRQPSVRIPVTFEVGISVPSSKQRRQCHWHES